MQASAKKLESLEGDYLSILERGINVLDLSQNAAEIYKSKKDDERRALMRDLFSNLRLNGKSLEVERTPLVAAIAKKVEQEKETNKNLLPLVEARFNAISPIWLERESLVQTFDEDLKCNVVEIRTLLDETPNDESEE